MRREEDQCGTGGKCRWRRQRAFFDKREPELARVLSVDYSVKVALRCEALSAASREV